VSILHHWISANKIIQRLRWSSWLIMILFLFLANFPFDKSKFSSGGITSIKLWAIRLAWSWNWFDSPILPSLLEGVLFLIESGYGNASGISDVAVANVNNLKWHEKRDYLKFIGFAEIPRCWPRIFTESQDTENRDREIAW